MLAAGDQGVSELCTHLCRACASELSLAGAGLTLISSATHLPESVLGSTPGLGATLEAVQYELGEGPCVDATDEGRPVLYPHLGSAGLASWPRFGRAALDSGCESLFAFPLQVGMIRLGALTLYSAAPRTLGADELAEALAYADVALTVLLRHQAASSGFVDEAVADQSGSRTDGEARVDEEWAVHHLEVHQATGIISERLGMALVDALLVLRARAYSQQLSLVEVAREVVARRLYLGDEDDDE
jgi:hypothetical protein